MAGTLTAVIIICHAVNLGVTVDGVDQCAYNAPSVVAVHRLPGAVPITKMAKIRESEWDTPNGPVRADNTSSILPEPNRPPDRKVDQSVPVSNINECHQKAANAVKQYGAQAAQGDVVIWQCVPTEEVDAAGIK